MSPDIHTHRPGTVVRATEDIFAGTNKIPMGTRGTVKGWKSPGMVMIHFTNGLMIYAFPHCLKVIKGVY